MAIRLRLRRPPPTPALARGFFAGARGRMSKVRKGPYRASRAAAPKNSDPYIGSARGRATIERNIPDVTISRLPAYLRVLHELQSEGETIVSSSKMGTLTGFSSEQIRKDLAYFGAFGTRGLGYNIELLEDRICEILGLDRPVQMALVGCGNIGQALVRYSREEHRHLDIRYLFDVDEELVGREIAGLRVMHSDDLESVISEKGIRLAVLAVPASAARDVGQRLVDAGVRAILNFAPIHLPVAREVVVRTVDLTSELESLAYYARDPRPDDEEGPAIP